MTKNLDFVSQLRVFEWPEGWIPYLEHLDKWAAGTPVMSHSELVAEVGPAHLLYDYAPTGILIADRGGVTDDYIFYFPNGPAMFAAVHLTWSGKRDPHPDFPSTELIGSMEELRKYLIDNP